MRLVVTGAAGMLGHRVVEVAGERGHEVTATDLPEPAILVTADAVRRGKPAPDAYLVAAQALGAEPGNCVVIEDAPAGVRAGRAAGMTVWAVTTTHTEAELEEADRLAADLAALLEPLGL